jgi:hypothetical protein
MLQAKDDSEIPGTVAYERAQAERHQRESDLWQEIAAQHNRNEEYYRGLVVQIGEMLGPDAYISDDGSIQQDVLCAKVPELVRSRLL